MQEDYYSDFEIITLNPNVEYQTSDDEECDYEGENGSDFEGMEYEDIVACQEGIKNVNNIIKYDNGDKSSQTPTTVVISELIKNVDHFESEMNIESNEVVMEDCVDVANAENVVVVVNNEEEKPMQFDNDKNVTTTVEITKPRKKLNLAEYKIHRAKKPLPTIAENKSVVLELCEMPESLPTLVLPTDPRSIKNLMTNQQQQTNDITDDNETVAMTVVEEVAPQNENFNNDENEVITQTIHPDYEEITYVDIGCNTDISIAPNEDDSETTSSSTNFLTNIVNSFQQNDNPKAIFNSSTSLLSSINAVVLSEKIHNSANDVNTNNSKNSNKGEIYEHGENKVIMHLRKDRLRPFRSSNGIQTEITPLFPPLILSPSLIFNRIKNARNFRRKSSRSRSRSRSISPEPEYYNRRNSYKYSRSVNSSSMNSSDSSDSDTSAYSSCRSSDSLKRFDNRYKRSYQRPNFNYQEERKIIYVGGLFEETTKDELRRKFLKYGTIKKISLHVKDDGSLRYGFVTFAESSAAFDVLDRFINDPAINNFDLRFGGRRKFCRETYADLDSCNQENDEYNNDTNNNGKSKSNELSFEDLLNMTKRKLCKNN